MRAGVARSLFCLAAAVTAAALADPLVEALSNRGVFGAGRFTDQSNADVGPALLAGLFFAALFVAGLVRRALLRATRAAIASRSTLRFFPATLALQIATLYGTETLEQLVVKGHLLGGTVWLGGPLGASLLLHAAVGLVVLAVLARLLDWVAHAIVEVIVLLRRLVLAWDALSPVPPFAPWSVAPAGADEPMLAALRGRAPPRPRT